MRQREHLLGRCRAIVACLGLALMITGAAMASSLFAVLAWPDELEHVLDFAVPSLLSLGVGAWAWRRHRIESDSLDMQEGAVVATLSWLVAPLVSAIPIARVEGVGPTRAIFEAVSGWTTTGLSVLDVAAAQHVTLLWRSSMQLVGGAGFAILLLATATRSAGPALGAAEGRGSQLVPNVRQSARLVLRIYAGYTLAGILAYRLVGLGWFDAINHAFAAVSTGGFSNRPEGMGAWDSPAVEAVTIALMLLGNLSFVTAWLVLRGRVRAVLRDGEVHVMATVLPVAIGLLLASTTSTLYSGAPKQVRVAAFEAISALTTTGFSTVTYTEWSPSGVLVLVVLMLIGGGTCSTAGGFKQYRVKLLWRAVGEALGRLGRSERTVADPRVTFGSEHMALTDAAIGGVAVFGALYIGTLLLGTFVLTLYGYSLQDSLFEFASSLGTVGLSIGVTTPSTPSGVLWVETAAMLLGRLEFLVVLVAVGKLYRDTRTLARGGARA